MASYWLVKTEPDVYSFEQLMKDKRTHWNGVRNHQAKNNLMKMKAGDLVLVYHSQGPKSVVGVAKVVKEHYPDPHVAVDDPKGDWVMVDLAAVKALKNEVTLAQLKADKKLKDIELVRQSRLSVTSLSAADFQSIVKLGGTTL